MNGHRLAIFQFHTLFSLLIIYCAATDNIRSKSKGKLKEGDLVDDLDVDGMKILNLILKKGGGSYPSWSRKGPLEALWHNWRNFLE
jgi:hypothetical protein